MTGMDDTAWHDYNCSDRGYDGNMLRFSVIRLGHDVHRTCDFVCLFVLILSS